MATYRTLFAHRAFRALWTSTALTTAAATMSSLALAALVHRQTGSALLAALSMFGPSLVQVLGASTLMSVADATPPRRALTVVGTAVAAAAVGQAVLPLGPPGRLALTFVAAYVTSIGTGVRWGLVSEVLPGGAYALARSAMNVAVGAFQVVGFATGGLLLRVLSADEVFALAAVLAAVAVPVLRRGVDERTPRRATRPGLRATWRGNRLLLAERRTRPVLLALTVPNGLIVGCEALFVPYAGHAAGVLLAAAALGMIGGDVLVGRLLDAAGRRRAGTALRVLLAVPFLVFALEPGVPVAAALAALAAVGYGATLGLQELLVALAPADVRGQALGVESAARMTVQGASAVLAGALADQMSPAPAIALLAAGSLAVTLALVPALSRAGAGSRAGRDPRGHEEGGGSAVDDDVGGAAESPAHEVLRPTGDGGGRAAAPVAEPAQPPSDRS